MDSIKEVKDEKTKKFTERIINNEDFLYDGVSAVSLCNAYLRVVRKKSFFTEKEKRFRMFLWRKYWWGSLQLALKKTNKKEYKNDIEFTKAVKKKEFQFQQMYLKEFNDLFSKKDLKLLDMFDAEMIVEQKERPKVEVRAKVDNFVLGEVIRK